MRVSAVRRDGVRCTAVLAIVSCAWVVALSACGGEAVRAPSSRDVQPPQGRANGDGVEPVAVPSDRDPRTPGLPPAVAPSVMRPLGASAFSDDLKTLGLDPMHLPPLEKLSPEVIRKLMPTFSRSLGVKCDFCHDKNNFKAWLPNKRVAAHMWNDYVVKLSTADANLLYCDSCHTGKSGKSAFLDRHDEKALSAWMDTNFVEKLKRNDQNQHGCETCHGKPFAPRFLETVRRSKESRRDIR